MTRLGAITLETAVNEGVAAAEPGGPPKSSVSSAVWTLFACQTVLAAGLALSFPFFALYLHRQRGLSMGRVGAWLSLAVLVGVFSQGFGGELSDIFGRRRVMVLSLWSRVVTILAMAGAMWLEWPFPVLMGIHLLSSFGANFFDPAARGWVADHTSVRERSRTYGLLRIANNLGWAIGPALGGWLAGRSYPLLFALTAVFCAVGAAAVTAAIRDRPGAARQEAFTVAGVLKAAEDPRFLRFCLYSLLISAAMAQLVVSLSVYATEFVGLTEVQVGILFALNGLLVVALTYPATAWLSGVPLTASLAGGCLLYAAGYWWVGFAGGFRGMAAAMVVITLGEIVVAPSLHSVAANMAPARVRGRYLGFLGISHQAGSALGPLTGGLGLQYVSARWLPGHWVAVAAVAAAAAAGFYSLGGVLRPAEQGLAELPAEAG